MSRLIVPMLCLLFALGIVANASPGVWLSVAIVLYGAPVACRVLPWPAVRRFGLWLALFMVLQTLVSATIFDADLKRLPEQMDVTLHLEDQMPGITGAQHVTTDEMGYRTTVSIDYGDSVSTRIFAIGGSTTEQIYVDDDATWTRLVQAALQTPEGASVEVINAGVSGLRARHYLATFESALALNPDAAIFLAGVNDWNSHIRREQASGFGSIAWETADAMRQWSLANSLVGRAAWRLWLALASARGYSIGDAAVQSAYLLASLRGSLARADRRTFLPDEVGTDYAAAMLAIAARCRDADIACVFVTQPTGYRRSATADYRSGFWMTPPYETYTLAFESMRHIADLYNDWLVDFAARERFPLCDARQWIEPSYRHLYDEVHFNVQGAAAMAAGLAQCLADQGWPAALQ